MQEVKRTVKILDKAGFIGRRFNRPIWRFSWVLLSYLLLASNPALSPRDFYDVILDVLFFTIPMVMLPVMVWGKLWQKVVAWLLSALPLGVLLVMIIEYFFGPI
ncbi:MAG: hypothetical protein M2R45_04716 [Verrucomicrobia subdivision 3 bacterium]|nr:hypothetical protein [Limisphaerales bacterium]MCS1411516.1 hypothetical protein [Limisphaerales bacterium]MCS1415252.1 hypothetical protein [Limisphaerales bacterium]MCS1416261.1 hypothetical protein [Limisphaerales bacterium]